MRKGLALYGGWFTVFSCSLALGFAACKTRDSSDAKVKVVNGTKLKDSDFPAVIQIAYELGARSSATCTATWVSDRTVLTAAHCVEGADRNPSKLSVVRGTGKGLKAKRVVSHPTYRPNSGIGHDIAIAIFEDNSSKFYIPMATSQASAGDPLAIIGYGKSDHLDPKSAGDPKNGIREAIKRRGTNKVSGIGHMGRVEFRGAQRPVNSDGTGENVLNSQGDSGGPMIIKSRVQGVSSSVSVDKDPKALLTGYYESVRTPAIEDWLKKLAASGVYMLGFSQGTESMAATDTTINGGDAGGSSQIDPSPSVPNSQPDDETPPPAPQAGPETPDSPGSPDAPGPFVPNPNPTPSPNPTPQPAQILDCNRDFSKIRQAGSGICVNRSSGFCYRYSGGSILYNSGGVNCP